MDLGSKTNRGLTQPLFFRMLYIAYNEEIHTFKEMDIMSNMKNLLGDMDFEEFEVKREQVLNKVKGLKITEFLELNCNDISTFYDYWLNIGGTAIASKRVRSHYGGILTTIEEVDEYCAYLLERFIGWLESF